MKNGVSLSVEKLAESIVNEAVLAAATDIHFIPKSNYGSILFRITHQLIPQQKLQLDELERLISYFKFKASMDIGEKRRPQNGAFSLIIQEQVIGLRLSTLPSTYSESLVIRLLPQEEFIPIHQLSIFPNSTKHLLSLMKLTNGLIIFTGPTGSGKTSTLYTLLRYSSRIYARNVITLEDPVEKNSEDLLQVQVNEKAGITYSTGLKAILRHDPDVIMVGEIRDSETAKIAVRASLTGHLVLTTMHTRNAKGAIHRLLEFGVNFNEIEQTLVAIAAQRLVHLICPFCHGICSEFCTRKTKNRSTVFEILSGEVLKEAIQEGKGVKMKKKYSSLHDVIAKGIAYGFVHESEFERWGLHYEKSTVAY